MPSRRSTTKPVALAAFVAAALVGALLMVARGGIASAAAEPVAVTAGCGKAPTLTTGTHSIQSGGQSRSYILNVPANYDPNHPYRLVFAFHWLGGTATDVATGQTVLRDVWAYYGLLPLSNGSTIFVAPQGISNGWANSGGRDVTLVDDLIRQVEGDLCVDTSQVFSVGFSYGAGMTYALACARATVFRAVALYSAGLLSGCSSGTQPIAYLASHGVSDGVLSISGGRSLRDRFVRNNGCTPQNAPEPAVGSRAHIITTFAGCSAGHPVEWIAFDGGHDASPADGPNANAPAPTKGRTTYLPAETWRFFTQFQPSGPTPSAPGSPSATSTSPGPRPTTPAPTPTSTGTSGGHACQVSDTVSAWNTGLTSTITITNTGGTALDGWFLTFTLPGGQTITSGWNATYSPTGGRVTATNVSYNGALAPGASTTIGFQATQTGNTAVPTSFALNGADCAVA